jgi:hypothetical protein
MLEINYNLNFGQLIKIAPDLKKYLWYKMKIDKPQMNTKVVNEKANTYVVPNINTVVVNGYR